MAGPRLPSVDLLRGAAIVGMVLVNEPAVGPPYLYRQLTHAAWNGWTFADVVFPVFLFVMGVVTTGRAWARRAVVLFALGVALNALPLVLAGSGFGSLRVMGVLQRIAVAGALASVVVRRVPRRLLLPVAAGMLLLTWAALATRPLTPSSNLPGLIDRHIFGIRHMYAAGHGGYDPEGLFGTVPAAAGVLIGAWAGDLLRSGHLQGAGHRLRLLAVGVAFVVGGQVWSEALPINKRLWTPSFVVFMSGLAMIALAALTLVGERATALRVIGANPLVVYVGTEATGIALSAAHHAALPFTYWVWSRWLLHPFGGKPGNLVWSLGVLAVWWGVAGVMWRKRWYVRV